ncbi:PREDICTED: ice-structuring protein-like [Vollenhovia emeryi]|uniref:ice-structuring protein-like n=1 Tax=Vollenhovia emeryi TaxID=411798 RepID=UPI0005F43452|nr:PREDICTED: ice-structuring protein-like [Vollenhovia emeryi]
MDPEMNDTNLDRALLNVVEDVEMLNLQQQGKFSISTATPAVIAAAAAAADNGDDAAAASTAAATANAAAAAAAVAADIVARSILKTKAEGAEGAEGKAEDEDADADTDAAKAIQATGPET